jgi:hypothetical protein
VPIEERFFRQLADDAAGAEAWLAAAGEIAQPSNVWVVPTSSVYQRSVETPLAPGQRPRLRGESLRSKTSPSVSSLLARRLAAMPDGRDACSMASAFAAWDPRAALPQLTRVERDTIAGFAAAPDKRFAGSCIARLTTGRADAGDASALGDYGAWIARTSPEDAFPEVERWFAPMIAHPTAQPIIAAATALFRPPSPWLPFVSENSGYRLTGILELDLYKLDAFRAHVAAELADKRKIGTISVTSNGVVIETKSFIGSPSVDDKDPLKPAEGTTMDLRVCDEYADEVTASRAPNAPAFRIYWPQAERDRAIGRIIAWVKTR